MRKNILQFKTLAAMSRIHRKQKHQLKNHQEAVEYLAERERFKRSSQKFLTLLARHVLGLKKGQYHVWFSPGCSVGKSETVLRTSPLYFELNESTNGSGLVLSYRFTNDLSGDWHYRHSAKSEVWTTLTSLTDSKVRERWIWHVRCSAGYSKRGAHPDESVVATEDDGE